MEKSVYGDVAGVYMVVLSLPMCNPFVFTSIQLSARDKSPMHRPRESHQGKPILSADSPVKIEQPPYRRTRHRLFDRPFVPRPGTKIGKKTRKEKKKEKKEWQNFAQGYFTHGQIESNRG